MKNEQALPYLKEFYYQDRDLNMVAVIQAKSIMEADAIMAEKKLKHFITGGGGRFVFHDAGTLRTAVLSRGKDGFPRDTYVVPGPDGEWTLGADSLYEGLRKHAEVINRYRYNPEFVVLWKTALGVTIVKKFDPPTFKEDRPQVPVNTFFN